MQSTAARVAVGVVLVAIVVVGFIALSGGDSDDSTTQTTATTATTETTETTDGANKPGGDNEKGGEEPAADVPVIEVKGGAPVGGVAELTFGAGDQIEFEVKSDSAAEVHVHGYDIAQEVPAGGSTEFSFPADIEGIFEVELEETATHIAEITVNP